MTATTLGKFVLESRHLYDGLTAEDFEAYSGAPASLFYLSDFPHWPALCQAGSLAPDALHERFMAIKKAVIATRSDHLKQWGTPIMGVDFLKDQVLNSPCLLINPVAILPPEACAVSNFLTQRLMPNRNAALPHTEILGRPMAFVPVGSYDPDEIVPSDPKRTWGLSLSNIALLPHFHEPTERYWNLLLNLPDGFIQRQPDPALVHLLFSLHEFRHGPQAGKPYAPMAYRLSSELDADLFALNTLAENGLGDELRYIYPKTRYLAFLHNDDESYLYAPVLEAFLERREPPRFRALLQAKDDFHQRILELSGQSHQSSGALTQDDKNAAALWIYRSFVEKPDYGYPLLKQWTDENAFADKPLVNQIAQGIVDSIQFFSPRLLTQRAYTLRFARQGNDCH